MHPVRGEPLEDAKQQELVVRLASPHAKDWKCASIITTAMKIEGYSPEMALSIADETLRYVERHF